MAAKGPQLEKMRHMLKLAYYSEKKYTFFPFDFSDLLHVKLIETVSTLLLGVNQMIC